MKLFNTNNIETVKSGQ